MSQNDKQWDVLPVYKLHQSHVERHRLQLQKVFEDSENIGQVLNKGPLLGTATTSEQQVSKEKWAD